MGEFTSGIQSIVTSEVPREVRFMQKTGRLDVLRCPLRTVCLNDSDSFVLDAEHAVYVLDGPRSSARAEKAFVFFGFPLSFTAVRDSTISVFGLDKERQVVWWGVSGALIVFITIIGCLVSDLGLLNSLGGAIFGAMITLIFPAMLCYFACKKFQAFGKFEETFALVTMGVGFVLLTFGSTIVCIQKFAPDVLSGGKS